MNILEIAKECGFTPHTIHGGLIVKHSSGAWVDIEDKLQAFAQAVIEDYKASLVPVAFMNGDDLYHNHAMAVKKQRDGFSRITPLYTLPSGETK